MSITKLSTALTISFIISITFLIIELLFILRHRRLKTRTRVDPSGPPTNTQTEDPVIDVFKLLEANGPSRFLCTIKEEEDEYVESTGTISGVDFGEVVVESEKVSLERGVKEVMVVSPPCDSSEFFTPVGSPARDGLMSVVVCTVSGSR